MAFCHQCGTTLDAGAAFCSECGTSLNPAQSHSSTHTEAITETDLRLCVGDKFDRYYSQKWKTAIRPLPTSAPFSLNLAAGLFPFYWLGYRKMYLPLVIGLVLYALYLQILLPIAPAWVVLLPNVLLLLLANKWYYRVTTARIRKVKQLGVSADITKLRIEAAGGTNLILPLILVSIFYVVSVLIHAGNPANIHTPTCDSPEVQQKVIELLNQQANTLHILGDSAGALASKVHEITGIEQVDFNKTSGLRTCRAMSTMSKGQGVAAYTIEWHDKQKGLFMVQLINANALPAAENASEVPAPELTPSLNEQPAAQEQAVVPTETHAEVPEAAPASEPGVKE